LATVCKDFRHKKTQYAFLKAIFEPIILYFNGIIILSSLSSLQQSENPPFSADDRPKDGDSNTDRIRLDLFRGEFLLKRPNETAEIGDNAVAIEPITRDLRGDNARESLLGTSTQQPGADRSCRRGW
jgi:hypothetical protein